MDLKISDITDELKYEIQNLLDTESELNLIIDSLGGSLFAGFSIYEMLRNTNKTVKARVEGNCFSAATIVLLGVKPENRTATPLSSFMIHSPILELESSLMNLKEAETTFEDIRDEYERLLSIYMERLNAPREVLEDLMESEKVFGSDKALELGFINHIDNYLNKMRKKNVNFLAKLFKKFMNEAQTLVLEDGTEAVISDVLAVGVSIDLVDGIYVTKEGDTITVENGVVIDIIPAEKEEEEPVEEVVNEEPTVEEEVAVEEVKEEVVPDLEEKIEELKEVETPEELDTVVEEISSIIEEAVVSATEAVMAKFGKTIENKKKVCNKKVVNKSARKDFSSTLTNKSENSKLVSKDEIRRIWGMK